MLCRSFIFLSRNSSFLASSCLVGNHNRNRFYRYDNTTRRYLAQNSSKKRIPGRFRRFLRWFGWGAEPIVVVTPAPTPPTTIQRLKQFLAISPSIERFFLRSHIIEDGDLARLISKTAAITIYAMIGVTTLGTLGIDTKPLLAGIGITGFTVGFALKEVATNFISGIFLVINKPFVRGCRIKIHGSGGGIEGKHR
jgi:small-conductance mechanosensitive channel